MSTQKMSFYSIRFKGEVTWSEIISNLVVNSEDSYCLINEESDLYISGCYIVRILQNQTQYNIESANFESVPVERTKVLKFDIYPLKERMILWGNK